MVKEPAIGQDSILLPNRRASVGYLSEVILISGDFLNLALAGRDQLWLASDRPGKASQVGLSFSICAGEIR
jgi:hypothetical protein